MRTLALSAALVLGLATQAQPQSPMTGAEFEAYVTGRTLTYATGGVPYGIEQYLPGRRVLWAFIGDTCRHGQWYEDDGRICFVYDYDDYDYLSDPGPHCWTFHATADGLRALFDGNDPATELVEVEQSPSPMICQGPLVGA